MMYNSIEHFQDYTEKELSRNLWRLLKHEYPNRLPDPVAIDECGIVWMVAGGLIEADHQVYGLLTVHQYGERHAVCHYTRLATMLLEACNETK